MKSFKQLLQESYKDVPVNESSIGRMRYHATGSNVAIVTANRKDFNAETNLARNQELIKLIKKAGYGYIHVKGHYIEGYGTEQARPVEEHSFVVIGKRGNDNGKLLNDARSWGEHFGQDSIFYKKHDEDSANLYGTQVTGNSYPPYGHTMDLGRFHPNMAGDFHTELKNTKTFAFSESVDPNTIEFLFEDTYF